MLFIDAQIRNEKLPNAFTLARHLEVSRKPIVRDLDFMRHRLGLPIKFNPVKNGYEYSRETVHFPLLKVTANELLALCISRQALEQFRDTPLIVPLRNAFEKIAGQLRDDFTISWDDLQFNFSLKKTGAAFVTAEIFDLTSRAVLERRELEFEYKKLSSRVYEKRVIQPYHLACIEGQWYIFGLDIDRQKIRTFVLTRIRSASLTCKRFRRPQDFSIQELLKNSFGVVEGSKLLHIRLRFGSFAAVMIRERRWHHSQQIEEMPNGGLVLNLRLDSLLEVEPWILSWGPRVEVLAPEELRWSVAKAHYDASLRYKKIRR